MADRGHPGVDAYLAALPAWQRELCKDHVPDPAIVANNRADGWRLPKEIS